MPWNLTVDHLAATFTPSEFAVNVIVQSTLLLAAGLIAGRLLTSAGTAVQSLVYRTVLAALLLCPLITWAVSAAGVEGIVIRLQPREQVATNAQVAESISKRTDSLPVADAAGGERETREDVDGMAAVLKTTAVLQMEQAALRETSAPPFTSPIAAADAAARAASPTPLHTPVVEASSWSEWVAWTAGGGWLLTTALLLVRLALSQVRTLRLRRAAIAAGPAEAGLCRQVAQQFGVEPPEVLRAPFLSGACLVGLWRPAVLLPEEDETPLRETLIHEIAHLVRRDCLWNLLRQLATALVPVQPLVWLLSRRIEQTAEEVCDDYVVQHGADRCNYAEHLVDLASRNMTPALPAGVGMISFRSLSARRIARILDASRKLSTRVGGRTIVAILLTAVGGTLLTASLGVGAGEIEAVEEQDAQRQKQNDGSGAGSDETTDAGTTHTLTMRGKTAEREMLVTGRVMDADSQPARKFELLVNLGKIYDREALSPKISGNRFEVWVPIGRSDWSSLELSASSKNGQQRVLQRIPTWGVRQAAIEGIDLALARASRTVNVSVTKDGAPVAKAQVTAHLQGNTLRSETNANGKARFHLLENERFSQLTAWTNDFQVGGYAFYRKPQRDPLANQFTIELHDCRDQTIQFVHAKDNSPIPSVMFALTIGTGPPNYNFPGNWQTLPQSGMTTNDKGEAIYRWFPDWKQHAVEIDILDPQWAKAESNDVQKADDGALVVKLKPRVARKPLIGQVTSGGLDVGGLVVEFQTFQGEEEHSMDHVYAFTDDEGKFSADCIPGSTYWAYVADERYVSNIIDLIPYDPETGKTNAALLHVSEGEPVEIRVTAGPRRQPMPHQWVHLRAPHDYSWRENGETRSGTGGKQWGVSTDKNGIARVRALTGSELIASVSAGEWRSPEQKVTVEAGVTTIEFHREIDTAREVTGRLIPAPGLEVDLAQAEIILESTDGETDERQAVKTDARGRFALKTKALRFVVFAYTADGKAAGITIHEGIDQPVELQLAPTVDLHGRLLGKDDKPLVGHAVRIDPQVRAKDRHSDVPFAVNFVAKEFETKTDNEGNYTLPNLPTQLAMTLRADPIKASEDDSHLATLILRAGEVPPRIVSRLGITPNIENPSLAEKYESLLRDAVLGDFHMMVLIFDSTANDFVKANLLDYDRTKEVGFYMQLEIGDTDLADAAAAQFVKMKKWPAPRPRTVFACALDESGKELGRIELDITQAGAPSKAEDFIRKHAPPPADAQKKWDAAFAEAKHSKRKVWARVSQRYCGPCLLMSRWLDDHRKLLERDYVVLKIDNVRDEHGEEIAQRIVNNRGDFGIPFSAIFDADENLLIDSEGPLGNIGHPSGYEGRRHLKKMLSDTRSNLSLEQIEQIVHTLDE